MRLYCVDASCHCAWGLDILQRSDIILPHPFSHIFLPLTTTFTHSELRSGTLYQNSVSDGTEVLLVPALETGVAVRERGGGGGGREVVECLCRDRVREYDLR